MLRTRDLKCHIFEIKGTISAGTMASIVSTLESCAESVRNLTHSTPELAHWNKSFPLPEPPQGKAFKLESIFWVDDGELPVDFIDKVSPTFFERALRELSPYSRMIFEIRLTSRAIALEDLSGVLVMDRTIVYLGFSHYASAQRWDPAVGMTAIRRMIELANIPVQMELRRGQYSMRHTQKGKLDDVPRKPTEPPGFIAATLPNVRLPDVIARFREFIHRPEFRPRNGTWSVGFAPRELPQPDPLGLLRRINKAGFPGKRASCEFFWYLKDYRHVGEMRRMAELLGGDAAQALMEFRLAGHNGRLDAVCTRKGQFKVFFSFDREEDHAVVAELLKIKLKPY